MIKNVPASFFFFLDKSSSLICPGVEQLMFYFQNPAEIVLNPKCYFSPFFGQTDGKVE